MSALDLGSNLTLAELIRRQEPNGELAELVDVISKEMPILQDAKWQECNNVTSHNAPQIVARPTGAERGYNMGVSSEAATTQVISEPTCMLDGISVVDAKLVEHNGGSMAARLQEDTEFFKGMCETFHSRFFNGNRAANPLQINGLNYRSDYNTIGTQVVDNSGGAASATANKTSMWFVQWGRKKVNLIYPKNDAPGGSQYGVKMEDYGKDIVTDGAGGKFPAWRTYFEFHFGLFIYDYRCVVRLANISTSNIDGVDDIGFDENKMIEAYMRLKYNKQGVVIYANETLLTQMWQRVSQKSNVYFTEDKDPFGTPMVRFMGCPIREVDSTMLTNTEGKIS
jgi:hypothetical protein